MRTTDLEEELFLLANLSPLFTGLPFVVWISPRGNARHDIRVKVSLGTKALPDNLLTVALRPVLRVIGDDTLASEQLRALGEWVELNWDALLSYWNGEIFTEEAIERLKPVSGTTVSG